MPVRRDRFAWLAFRAVGVCGIAVGVMALGGPSLAQSGCSTYSALAAASGVRTLQSAAGLLLVSDADANLPAAQAQVDSLSGSTAWAGAPYSAAVVDNLGLTGVSANQVPVFAVSHYPTQQKAGMSTPAATIEAKTGPRSATARVVGGGPASDQASAGQLTTSAAASCGDDATLKATADNIVQMVDIKDVLQIGSVRSHAQAVVDPAGHRVLNGTMEVEAATVLGQRVAITDRGVVTGGSTTPLPDDPLAQALADAGISVRYVAAVKDTRRGEVFAPGLDVVVTRGVQDVGTGPASTTYTLGRAYARAAAPPSDQTVPAETGSTVAPPVVSEPPPQEAEPVAVTPAPSSSLASGGLAQGGGQGTTVPTSRIANASNAGAYAAMGAGALLFMAAWLLFERLGARLRWR